MMTTKIIWRPITLGDAESFRRIQSLRSNWSCEQNFTNLFLWSGVYRNELAFVQDRVYAYNAPEKVLLFPAGPYPAVEELLQVVQATRESGRRVFGVYDVPDAYLEEHPECVEHFQLLQSDDVSDYIYSCWQLAHLNGAKLRKKRNLIKQFIAGNPSWRQEEIHVGNLSIVRNLAARLNAEHEKAAFIEEENAAMECAWEHFFAPELQLKGILLYAAGDRPCGFSVYSPLGKGGWDIHFEKSDHGEKGAAQMLIRLVAEALSPMARIINREQDLGESGLRQAKQSLEPMLCRRRTEFRLPLNSSE